MLAGELEYRKGKFETAFYFLWKAIVLEDALGGLLLEQGRVEEAETLFKQDLGFALDYSRRKAKLNNVWGLQG